MTEATGKGRKRLRFGPLLRALLPSLVTLVVVVLLVFAIFFTEFDRQWVAFLAGILFGSVLALVSVSLKSGWRAARRAAEVVDFDERLSAEIEQHRGTREQLERELALHQQDRTRLAREIEAHRLAAKEKLDVESLLGMLELHLDGTAFYVDHDQRYRFHTRGFSAWTGVPPERIDGFAFAETLAPRDAESMRPQLLDALDGRAVRAEVLLTQRDGTEQAMLVECLPQSDAAGQVSGVLVQVKQAQAAAAAAAPSDTDISAAAEARHGATKLVIADQSGNAVYLSSLTEELTGWGNPRERIRQAIQNDGFDLYAQDIVALRTDAPSGNMQELLIRMRDEEQNLVPPGTFLPIAERFGMMPDIDRFVVRKAIAARAAAGSSAHAASLPVLCINLARASIEDRSFPKFVARALTQSGVPGQALCFEITDNDAIACAPEAARFANELKPLGCRFTLDGFGRMGIGFDHVKTLPLDFLKIDGSIVLQILRVPEALAKVRAIQRVCKVIGIRTIAEMVESDDVRERLRAVEIGFAQGFGISQPRPFSQIVH
jgi:EAL domain-containing protein (putative c-di-GMP-specific phosphodiesterase class I)/PAS domain-containing protein